jgi:hypothetical protein
MTKPIAPYDPASLVAIRQARADLYQAQADRRRIYLLTGVWGPRNRATTSVQQARADLDNARAAATQQPQPKR